MSKRKKINYEFIFDNQPDEETLQEFHKAIAEAYIKKYGVEVMKEVVRQIREKEESITNN